MSTKTLRLLLALAGASLQIAGFTWAMVDASLARGREFGEYGLLRRTWMRVCNWLAFWLGPQPQPKSVSVALSSSVGLSGSLTGIKTPESEIERLARELQKLSATVERLRQDTDERLSRVQSDVQTLTDDLAARIEGIEERERSHRRGALRREQRAAQLFMAGVALSTASYLV
jgi:outer membrane murein-binding lipoprotein Lpp